MSLINIYCDESCHLENDGIKPMVLGAVYCSSEKSKGVSRRIRELKIKHGYPGEIKWKKISNSNVAFYLDLIDYFFLDTELHFRGFIIPDKSALDHKKFNQTHDEWYYKMYFDMLKVIFDKNFSYRILLDIKDSNSATKRKKLHDVLCNSLYDFNKRIIVDVQAIRSHHSNVLQLADLLSGALSYTHRGLTTSAAKLEVIKRIKHRSGFSLLRRTLLREEKFNLFVWNPQEGVQ
jgi:hypothetical protein